MAAGYDVIQISGGEGTSACSGGAMHPFASHKGTLDEGRFSGQSDFREKRFKFVTDP